MSDKRLRAVKPPTKKQLAKVDDEITRKATELRTIGYNTREIAEVLQMTENDVSISVRNSMEQAALHMSEESKAEILALELIRLDALQRGLWQQATNGDRGSVETILKVMASRERLLQLAESANDVHNQTVVITGDSENYIKTLGAING